eukprot:CAMPEP_0172452246 /NCGR_PEP_ID=MMETSP1065-20121228/9976_1 /TAXON_ID=265537 /ORGANISM="Amphiprora paludosa, Strain CCMP125" /LENGTH=97 /DNA_ID=CAMNT_0013204283 /DNA_START=606 /DNA_END=899 /DNA_ORIENTATION=+
MSLGEYSTLMKEAGLSPASVAGGMDGTTKVELTQTLRLDEKWEKFCANAVAEGLRMASQMMEPVKVLIYSMAASMLLLATAKVIRALRESEAADRRK